jgi:hypothetical protein
MHACMYCAKPNTGFLVDALHTMKDYLTLPRGAKMVLVTEPIERRYYVGQFVKCALLYYCVLLYSARMCCIAVCHFEL